jgi:hypothetical protein
MRITKLSGGEKMPVSKRVIQRTLAALTLTALAIAPNVFATPIPLGGGGVNNVANMIGGTVAVTTTTPCIAFSGPVNAPTPCNGTATIGVSGVDPIFGTTGTIKDISTVPLTSFKTVNLTIGGGPAIFDLLNIVTPVGFAPCTAATNSGSCSTGTFILTQTSTNQVSIGLSTNEIGYLGSSASGSTPYIGVFTTQLSGSLTQFGCTGANCADTIGNIFAFEGAGGKISSTWSATESPVAVPGIPEPMSFLLLGSGLVGISMLRQRRRS